MCVNCIHVPGRGGGLGRLETGKMMVLGYFRNSGGNRQHGSCKMFLQVAEWPKKKKNTSRDDSVLVSWMGKTHFALCFMLRALYRPDWWLVCLSGFSLIISRRHILLHILCHYPLYYSEHCFKWILAFMLFPIYCVFIKIHRTGAWKWQLLYWSIMIFLLMWKCYIVDKQCFTAVAASVLYILVNDQIWPWAFSFFMLASATLVVSTLRTNKSYKVNCTCFRW